MIKRVFIEERVAVLEVERQAELLYEQTQYKTEICHANVLRLYKDLYGMNDRVLVEYWSNLIKKVKSKDIKETRFYVSIVGITPTDKEKKGLANVEVDLDSKILRLYNYQGVSADIESEKISNIGFSRFIKM